MIHSSELRLGVVGAGRIAQVAHLPAASKAERVRLTAICDASPMLAGQVSERYGVKGCTDFDELLTLEVDAVLIATPDRSHLPLAKAAICAGKHVLIEKPLAESTEDAETLVALARAAGVKLQVGAMKRHDPGIAFAATAVERIGEIVSAQAWYRVMSALRPSTEATLFPATVVDEEVRELEATHKADRDRYLLQTHGAHVFDGLRYLVGGLSSVSARLAHVGSDYSWHGTGRLARAGGLASFEISANVHAEWAEGFDIYGTRGSVRVRSHFPFFRRASDVAVFSESDSVSTVPSFGDTDPYERQLEAFARAVLDGAPTSPDGAEGAAAVRMIEAVRESVAAGGTEVAL